MAAAGQGHENWSLAGALWDSQGLWGNAGSYWVYDHPYLTAGTTCTDVKQSVHHNDKSCAGPYYGFSMAYTPDSPGTLFTAPINYHRNDNNTDWFVDAGACTWKLSNMRFSAMVKGGSYTVTFPKPQLSDDRGTCSAAQIAAMPAVAPPHQVQFGVTNLFTADDGFLLAIEYSGNAVPTVFHTTWPNANEASTKNPYGMWDSVAAWKAGDTTWKSKFRGEYWNPILPGASLDAVKNGGGNVYWQDRANNLVWILVRKTDKAFDGGADYNLYGGTSFVIDDTL